MKLTSDNLINEGKMPQNSLCPLYDGNDLSPSLKWEPVQGAHSYALFCYDPDLPGGQTWIHWLISYIPKNVLYLPNMRPINKKYIITQNNQCLSQGINGWGKYGWGGPCPGENLPSVIHHYHFIIYALDTIICEENSTQFLEAIKGHIIDKSQLTGTFLKPN